MVLREGSEQKVLHTEEVFKAWQLERLQQVTRAISLTTSIADRLAETSPWKIFARDSIMKTVGMIPPLRDAIEKMDTPALKYDYSDGMPFLPAVGGGFTLPQVYCVPLGLRDDKQDTVSFTDDVIFKTGKKGLLQLVCLVKSAAEAEKVKQWQAVREAETLSDGEVRADEVTYIVQDVQARPLTASCTERDDSAAGTNTFRVATGDEFAKSKLCQGRSPPERYSEHRMLKETKGKQYVLVRWDWYIFAACQDEGELISAMAKIPAVLKGKSGERG